MHKHYRQARFSAPRGSDIWRSTVAGSVARVLEADEDMLRVEMKREEAKLPG